MIYFFKKIFLKLYQLFNNSYNHHQQVNNFLNYKKPFNKIIGKNT
jgi:hypothetical protein